MANRLRWPTRRADTGASTSGRNATAPRARGAVVESAARDFLIARGLASVAANANYRGGELDLVMRDGTTLVFVEVRYRAASGFGSGATSITPTKRRRLVHAAGLFLASHPALANDPCRFDVVDASGDPSRPTLQWIRDAFRVDD